MTAAGAGLHAAEDGVVLSISTKGCSAAPFFRAAQVEHCLTGLPFFDVITLDGAPAPSSDGNSGPRGLIPGTIVEVYGPSGSGKSEIALNALAAWVLPAPLGGVGGTALVLDLDFTFAAARLHRLLLARVHAAGTAGAAGAAEAAVEAALKRVAVAHCGDELEAFAAVEVLKYDLNHPSSSNGSGGPNAVGPVLVVLDGLGALHHERRAAEGCKQPESCFDYMLARALGRLTAARAVSVLACKPALVGGKRVTFAAAAAGAGDGGGGGGGMVMVEARHGGGESFPSVEHREYLPPQWAKLVTHRLSLLRDAPGETPYFTARLFSLVPGGLVGAGPGKDGCGAYWFRVEDGGVHVLPPSPEEEETGGGGGW